MSSHTVNSAANTPSMRHCCNTTLQTIGHGFKKFGLLICDTAKKVVEKAKPLFQRLGEQIKFASAIVWKNTCTFFIKYRKEFALVALGAGIVGLAIGLGKAIQFCCKNRRTEGPENPGDLDSSGSDFEPSMRTDTLEPAIGPLPQQDQRGTNVDSSRGVGHPDGRSIPLSFGDSSGLKDSRIHGSDLPSGFPNQGAGSASLGRGFDFQTVSTPSTPSGVSQQHQVRTSGSTALFDASQQRAWNTPGSPSSQQPHAFTSTGGVPLQFQTHTHVSPSLSFQQPLAPTLSNLSQTQPLANTHVSTSSSSQQPLAPTLSSPSQPQPLAHTHVGQTSQAHTTSTGTVSQKPQAQTLTGGAMLSEAIASANPSSTKTAVLSVGTNPSSAQAVDHTSTTTATTTTTTKTNL